MFRLMMDVYIPEVIREQNVVWLKEAVVRWVLGLGQGFGDL